MNTKFCVEFFWGTHISHHPQKMHCITLCKWSWLTLVNGKFLAYDSSIMKDNDSLWNFDTNSEVWDYNNETAMLSTIIYLLTNIMSDPMNIEQCYDEPHDRLHA